MRITAQFAGVCNRCGLVLEQGTEIEYRPPKGRGRGRAYCLECARRHHDKRFPPSSLAWRKNASWMSAEDFAMVEEAMAKKVA